MKKEPAYLPYLKTLRRVPPRVILEMAGEVFNLHNPHTCLCGWAWRKATKAHLGLSSWDFPSTLVPKFGGTQDEWYALYAGGEQDGDHLASREEAFARRVAECVR